MRSTTGRLILDIDPNPLRVHNHAKTALDVACWDAFGKAVDLPACELPGGATGIPMPMLSSIHAGESEEVRQRVTEHRARGYRNSHANPVLAQPCPWR